MTDARTSPSGTRLGVVDVVLTCSRFGPACVTRTELRSAASNVARSVPLIVGALLFAQRQLRAIPDPARLACLTSIEADIAASRAGRLYPPAPPPDSREVATYKIVVSANGAFHADFDQKLDGILSDQASAMATTAIATELLSTLPGAYRTFYREMLQAALPSWRERRPLPGVSTWNWPTALRRLDVLIRENGATTAEAVTCPDCNSLRPADFACLRCGSTAGPVGVAKPASSMLAASEGPASETFRPPAASRTESPSNPPLPIVDESPRVGEAAGEPAVVSYTANIVPAQDIAPDMRPRELDERFTWPLARLPRRLGASVIDVAIAAVLGIVGAFGATTIALASGSIAPDQSGQAFFPSFGLIIAALYFVLGWAANETVGMLIFRLRILRQTDRKPEGLVRAVVRAAGYLVAIGVGLGIFVALLYVDSLLPFVQGTADTVYQIISALVALYVAWSLTGQRIISGKDRQTLGDQLAHTVVTVRK